MRRLLAVTLLLLLAAGCAGPAHQKAAPSVPLEPGDGSIEGIIVDRDYLPIAGARVALVGTQHAVESGIEGSFRFAPLPPSEYLATVEAAGYAPASSGIRVSAGAPTAVELVLVELPRPEPRVNATSTTVMLGPNAYFHTAASDLVWIELGWRSMMLEVEWEPNWEFAERMNLTVMMGRRNEEGHYAWGHSVRPLEGASPLRWRIDSDEWQRMREVDPELFPYDDPKWYRDGLVPGVSWELQTRGDPDVQVQQAVTIHAVVAYVAPLPQGHTRLG